MPIFVTKTGYQTLFEQREEILAQIAQKKIQMGETAKADPDLPENAEFKALRVELMFTLPTQLDAIDKRIKEAVLIEENDAIRDEVSIGTVVVFTLNGEEMTYRIAGAGESSLDDNVLSYEAPLAQALLGAKAGEKREFHSPRGSVLNIEIISLS